MKTYIHYLYVILAAACWGVIGLFNRILGELGVDVLQRVTVRNFGALLVLTVVFALVRRDVFFCADQRGVFMNEDLDGLHRHAAAALR